MDKVKPRAYIVNFWFNSIKYRAWFMADDTKEKEEDLQKAMERLDDIKKTCSDGEEFFKKAIEHIQKYGFIRVKE